MPMQEVSVVLDMSGSTERHQVASPKPNISSSSAPGQIGRSRFKFAQRFMWPYPGDGVEPLLLGFEGNPDFAPSWPVALAAYGVH